ncbi:DUF1801 domain-containing protein [Balneola vulgaris]|uniref:DUF1801 domain-containing protein n=1 Tax=Balneola vulgaris TaxID=287535 RepID=UPI00036CDA48|nr:DUF1801 domain-containing protein [Balneola vulgaris]
MAENKTRPTDLKVSDYLAAIENDQRREDCTVIHDMMKEVTQKSPKMWGHAIVGFGTYHYKYESGREGDMLMTGFSNRVNAITLYVMTGFPRHQDLMDKLGKYKTGKSCLYIKKLADVDINVLRELIEASYEACSQKYDIID